MPGFFYPLEVSTLGPATEFGLHKLFNAGCRASSEMPRDDYADFILKIEVSCTGGTDSGNFFRCGKELVHAKFPAGYEANTALNCPTTRAPFC